MFQIASGKFFKGKEWHENEGRAILYSNLELPVSLATPFGELHPDSAGHGSNPTSLIFTYNNRLEINRRVGGLVRVGDEELVDSFRCFAVLGLGAYFHSEKSQVSALCRARRIKIYHLDSEISFDHKILEEFPLLVQKAIDLPRRDFEIVDRCVKQFTRALEVCESNIDLAYSMFVYCLEALAQEYGEDFNSWENYDPSSKEKLDEIFDSLDGIAANKIKSVLLSASHNRLRRKFVNFVSSNVSEGFFTTEAPSYSALPKSSLSAALNMLYATRSGFVHELTPIHEQIRHKLFEGDVLYWENEPYFTLNGIIRLTRHVLLQVIRRLPVVATEDFDWRSNLPGVIKMNLAPEYWAANVESFQPEQAIARLSGFLISVEESSIRGKPLLDIRPLLDKIELVFSESEVAHKRAMLGLHGIFYALTPKDTTSVERQKFFQIHANVLKDCSMEAMVLGLFQNGPWKWPANECAAVFDLYLSQKVKPKKLVVPRALQLGIAIQIANLCLREGNRTASEEKILAARLEVPGDRNLQERLVTLSQSTNEVDVWATIRNGL